MSKESIKLSIKRVVADRVYFLILLGLLLVGLIYALVVSLNIYTSDVTVYVRYTAFGEAHFYKDYWQYFIAFVIFGLVVAIVHAILMVKLHDMGRRQTGIIIGWFGIAILVISLSYTLAVISLGHVV